MPELRELLEAESERYRPHLIPPFHQLATQARLRRTRRRGVLSASTATVVVAAITVTATIGLRLGGGDPGPAREQRWTVATACPGWSANQHEWETRRLPTLPPDFGSVTRAFICETTVDAVPGHGEWLYQEARLVTGGLDELLAIYALPDEPHGSGLAISCPNWIPLPPLWLHGDSVLGIRAPADQCGNSIRAARAAAESLTTEVVASDPLRQVREQAALDSWCSQMSTPRCSPRLPTPRTPLAMELDTR